MMKIAGTVNDEGSGSPFVFAVKLFDQASGRGKTQPRSPGSRIDGVDRKRAAEPGIIQIEMNRRGQGSNVAGEDLKATAALH